jgi:hypothetical protein
MAPGGSGPVVGHHGDAGGRPGSGDVAGSPSSLLFGASRVFVVAGHHRDRVEDSWLNRPSMPVTLWRAGLSSSPVAPLNKAASPRVLLVQRRRSTGCMFSFICLNWHVPEGFANELHWTHHVLRLLIWIIRSCTPEFSLWPFGFRGSASKLCWLLIL